MYAHAGPVRFRITVGAETRSARTRFRRTGPTSPSPTLFPPRPSRSRGFVWETPPSAWNPRRSPTRRRCWPCAGATPRNHYRCSRQQRCCHCFSSANDVVSFARLLGRASWEPCRWPARRGGWPRTGSSNTRRRTQPRLPRPPRRRHASGGCAPAAEGRWLGGPLEAKLFEKKTTRVIAIIVFNGFGLSLYFFMFEYLGKG